MCNVVYGLGSLPYRKEGRGEREEEEDGRVGLYSFGVVLVVDF